MKIWGDPNVHRKATCIVLEHSEQRIGVGRIDGWEYEWWLATTTLNLQIYIAHVIVERPQLCAATERRAWRMYGLNKCMLSQVRWRQRFPLHLIASYKLNSYRRWILEDYQGIFPRNLHYKRTPHYASDHEIEVVPRGTSPHRSPFRLSSSDMEELGNQGEMLLEQR